MVSYGPVWLPIAQLLMYGSVWYGMVPYGQIWSHWSNMVLYCPVGSLIVPYGTVWSHIWYHMILYAEMEYCASAASILAEEIWQNAEGFVESVGSIEEMSQMINNVDCHS